MNDAEWDEWLARLDRCSERASLGAWRHEFERTADGLNLSVVCGDGGTLDGGFVSFGDAERGTDMLHDVGVAVVARNALPVLVANLRKLRADLAESLGSLTRLLATSGAMDERLCQLDPEYARARLRNPQGS